MPPSNDFCDKAPATKHGCRLERTAERTARRGAYADKQGPLETRGWYVAPAAALDGVSQPCSGCYVVVVDPNRVDLEARVFQRGRFQSPANNVWNRAALDNRRNNDGCIRNPLSTAGDWEMTRPSERSTKAVSESTTLSLHLSGHRTHAWQSSR